MSLLLVVFEGFILFDNDRPLVPAVVLALATVIGFLGAALLDWVRFYIYWHPRAGIPPGDDRALEKHDRWMFLVIGLGTVLVVTAMYLDWAPYVAERVAIGTAFGFWLFQYWPFETVGARWFGWVGRLFAKLLQIYRPGATVPSAEERAADDGT